MMDGSDEFQLLLVTVETVDDVEEEEIPLLLLLLLLLLFIPILRRRFGERSLDDTLPWDEDGVFLLLFLPILSIRFGEWSLLLILSLFFPILSLLDFFRDSFLL